MKIGKYYKPKTELSRNDNEDLFQYYERLNKKMEKLENEKKSDSEEQNLLQLENIKEKMKKIIQEYEEEQKKQKMLSETVLKSPNFKHTSPTIEKRADFGINTQEIQKKRLKIALSEKVPDDPKKLNFWKKVFSEFEGEIKECELIQKIQSGYRIHSQKALNIILQANWEGYIKATNHPEPASNHIYILGV